MTEITITGPGGVINFEYYVILKALQAAGIKVEEQNEYGYTGEDRLHLAEQHTSLMAGRLAGGDIKEWKVKLKANHIPWGG